MAQQMTSSNSKLLREKDKTLLLRFPPIYVVVGAYRFLTDSKINRPIWARTRSAFQRAAILALVWACISLPFTRYYVRTFLKSGVIRYKEDAQWFGVNLHTYATWLLVLQQASFILETFIAKELKQARKHAYEALIESRGKGHDFWIPYQEEWRRPPVERAQRSMERIPFLMKANNRWFRIAISKLLLQPLHFIPFLGLVVSAGLSSVTAARTLHRPYFRLKAMSPLEQELFIVERLKEFRMFGFTAALLEKLPLIGIVFSISNQIGAAMWAHDMEKHQRAFRDGRMVPEKVYVSKTAAVAAVNDLPEDFSGGFPTHKGPVKITSKDQVQSIT